jgi:hypothetical protein
MKISSLFLSVIVISCTAWTADVEPTAKLQDFEGAYQTEKYPAGNPGSVSLSKEWKADGEQSLKIDPSLMSAITLKMKDWSGYNTVRFSVRNAGERNSVIGFEISDELGTKNYWNRYQSNFTVKPGEHVIAIDFSGGLYRGEPTSRYRGPVKTPVDVTKIVRLIISNSGTAPLFVDKVQLVKVNPLATPGGFAFDFGGPKSIVMSQFTGVEPTTMYSADAGYGMVGGPGKTLMTEMTWPTPMLGDGIMFPTGGFQIDLDGGEYIGLVAFERGGYWGENESSKYEHAALKHNGNIVHEHDFAISGIHFFFQDTELTDMSQLNEKIIWPANAISRIKFTAARGANVFTLDVRNSRGFVLRVAGLILAPDTAEGRKFLEAHESLQRKSIAETFSAADKSRREQGRAVPNTPLVYEFLAPGASVFPKDWPATPGGPLPELYAVNGQTVCVHLGLYAQKDSTVTVKAPAPKCEVGSLSDGSIAYGIYMPDRYQTGSAWLAINHYRPEATFAVGPDLSRSLIVEFTVPSDAKAGKYSTTITLSGVGDSLSVPVSIQVVPIKLADFPIPVGLLGNAIVVRPEEMDESDWWRMQESVLREQMSSGLNTLTGGSGVAYHYVNGHIDGARGLKYLRLAEKFGPVRAVFNYGGFYYTPGKADAMAFAKALKEFEQANKLPPHYLNCYDEPSTDEAMAEVIAAMSELTAAGLRTLGLTSAHFDNELWVKMIKLTFAPGVNEHDAGYFARVKAFGNHPWVYNQGFGRMRAGLHLWRQITLGCEGRVDWIGFNTQGFAFHNLDGREPAAANFAAHSKFGVLKTPSWLSRREGLLDCRLRLALEQLAPAEDPVVKMWTTDGYCQDDAQWSNAKLETIRVAMIKRLAELSVTAR